MSTPERVGVRMPTLYTIPIGTKVALCGCGMYQYFVKHDGVTHSISISGKFYSKTARAEITVPGCKPPTATSPGLGFDHHIDCAQREQFRRARKDKREIARDVAAAEELARRFGVRCSGDTKPAVGDADACNGDAVVALNVVGKLFATPCSVHADRVQKAIRDAGRGRELTMHALEEFLVDRGPKIAEQFVAKAMHIREWHNARGGVVVPATGHL